MPDRERQRASEREKETELTIGTQPARHTAMSTTNSTWTKQLEEVWPRPTPPTPMPALTLSPTASLEYFLPTDEHSARNSSDRSDTPVALQPHKAADGDFPVSKHHQQQQGDASIAAAVTIGPWRSDESPLPTTRRPVRTPCREWGAWATSSTSICDHAGSWCNSVETPIAAVRPARQVYGIITLRTGFAQQRCSRLSLCVVRADPVLMLLVEYT